MNRPVWATSRSIMSFSRESIDSRVSKMLKRTGMMVSTSEGGHISHMVIASTIWNPKLHQVQDRKEETYV